MQEEVKKPEVSPSKERRSKTMNQNQIGKHLDEGYEESKSSSSSLETDEDLNASPSPQKLGGLKK